MWWCKKVPTVGSHVRFLKWFQLQESWWILWGQSSLFHHPTPPHFLTTGHSVILMKWPLTSFGTCMPLNNLHSTYRIFVKSLTEHFKDFSGTSANFHTKSNAVILLKFVVNLSLQGHSNAVLKALHNWTWVNSMKSISRLSRLGSNEH